VSVDATSSLTEFGVPVTQSLTLHSNATEVADDRLLVDGLQRAGLELVAQSRGISAPDDGAAVEYDHLIGRSLDEFEIVRTQHHRGSSGGEFVGDREYVFAHPRIESGCGFVQDDQRRVADRRLCDPDESRHAAGERLDRSVRGIREPDAFELRRGLVAPAADERRVERKRFEGTVNPGRNSGCWGR